MAETSFNLLGYTFGAGKKFRRFTGTAQDLFDEVRLRLRVRVAID
jgi:hypothetical protein